MRPITNFITKHLSSGCYNTGTKKIVLNTKSDYVYFHEKRHQWQDEFGLLDLDTNLMVISAFTGILFYPSLVSFVCLTWIPIYFVLIELDAHIVAIRSKITCRKKVSE